MPPLVQPETAQRSPASDETPAIELRDISKAFPGVQANDNVSLVLRRGEVHCLLGENGAGKSTLMAILAGMLQPDQGQIRVDGVQTRIESPRKALDLGIGTVYQHSTLIGPLSVVENLLLGENRALRLKVSDARRRLDEFAAMLGVEINPDDRAEDLALGRQQQVEIIKALWRGSRVLILDEPTSMLTPQAVAELQKVLERLKSSGLAIVFITHKLHEAVALGDRITVLRQGRVTGSIEREQIHRSTPEQLESEIVRLMFGEGGESVAAEVAELQIGVLEGEKRADASAAEVALELQNASAAGDGSQPGIDDVSLAVHLGEVVGVAGVDGNGQRALAEVISGQRRLSHGEIRYLGAPVGSLGVAQREKLGLRYVTDDRLGEGIVGSLPVSVNLVLKRIGRAPYWRHGRMRREAIDRDAQGLVERFDIRTPGLQTRASTLSGGNIQKLLLARELSFDAKVVVFHKPTYGLDLKTTRTVRRMIGDLRDGRAALVISTDLDELLELSDRIAVLSRGRIVGMVDNGPGAAEHVGRLMIGDVTLGLQDTPEAEMQSA
ncbi:MAG TPA: ABC transporter ATP-binding protein [Solirubrobacteraceae bacterium]|nr:ABC transporter ATP-binding protein [Solirubrobacteraceae bacterium]